VILFFLATAEILFFIKIMTTGNGDGLGVLAKTILLVVLLCLAYLGKNWGRWLLIIVLFLLSLACILAAFENEDWGFIFIVICYLIVVLGIYDVEKIAPAGGEVAADSMEVVVTAEQALPPSTFILNGANYRYPSLLKRYKALFVDGLLLLILMISTMVLLGDNESRPFVMIGMWLTFILIYEPVLTTYSATIGQRLMGIRVRDYNDPTKRIRLGNAYIRVLVKDLLGWISFVTIHFNPEHRAIHDLACLSVVIEFPEGKALQPK
jgi:uncharacterized RDD family membrane protein YckC